MSHLVSLNQQSICSSLPFSAAAPAGGQHAGYLLCIRTCWLQVQHQVQHHMTRCPACKHLVGDTLGGAVTFRAGNNAVEQGSFSTKQNLHLCTGTHTASSLLHYSLQCSSRDWAQTTPSLQRLSCVTIMLFECVC